MLDQIKNNYYQKMKNNLGDIRFIVLMVFLAIVFLVTWSGIKTVQSNYKLQKKITKINQSNQLQKLKNNNLSLQNNYLNTNQFIEISARQNFGLGASGESEVIIPKGIALKQLAPLKGNQITDSEVQTIEKSSLQNNFQAWISFFMHH